MLLRSTGAAILTTVVTEFTATPAMTVDRIGCGAGTKDFLDRPNILRLWVGTANPAAGRDREGAASDLTDTVTVLETNLDDCTGEVIGCAIDRLFAAGAMDVFAVPIQMKKNRPAVLLTVICDAEKVPELEAILFRETGTFGIRRTTAVRSKLHREVVTVNTPWGEVKAKRGWRDGFEIVTPEYDDCVRVAREQGMPLRVVYEAVRGTFKKREHG